MGFELKSRKDIRIEFDVRLFGLVNGSWEAGIGDGPIVKSAEVGVAAFADRVGVGTSVGVVKCWAVCSKSIGDVDVDIDSGMVVVVSAAATTKAVGVGVAGEADKSLESIVLTPFSFSFPLPSPPIPFAALPLAVSPTLPCPFVLTFALPNATSALLLLLPAFCGSLTANS